MKDKDVNKAVLTGVGVTLFVLLALGDTFILEIYFALWTPVLYLINAISSFF